MNDLFSLAGRTALVTGGSRGIGRMIAAGFLAAGAKVYISARKAAACRQAAAELSSLGPCVALPADVSTREGIGALVEAYAAHEPQLYPEFGRAAAVLVPLLPRPEGLHVLFTERSKELRSHAGQVSFPGGSVDPADKDVRAAALREAREEVGLRAEHVELIGQVDDCPTFVTGYVISPFVGGNG